MRTLTQYFVARYLTLFAAILAASTLTIVIVETLLNYDVIFGMNEGGAGLLTYVFLRVPSYYLRDLIPVAAFGASFFSLGLAVRWFEITALKAGGISPHRAALPLLAVAALLSLCAFGVNETIVTGATRAWNEQQQAADEQLVFRRRAFWYHKGSIVYNIMGSDPATHTLRGVEIIRRTPRGRLELDILAERATVAKDGTWHLENATVRHFTPDRPEEPTRIEFGVTMDIHISDDRDLLLRQTDAGSLPLPELVAYIERYGGDDEPASRTNRERLRTLLHQRLSEPVLVLLFTLLAVPLALRATPGGGLGPTSLYAVGTLGLFFLARSVTIALATDGIMPGAATVWGVLCLFALWGCLGLWRTAR